VATGLEQVEVVHRLRQLHDPLDVVDDRGQPEPHVITIVMRCAYRAGRRSPPPAAGPAPSRTAPARAARGAQRQHGRVGRDPSSHGDGHGHEQNDQLEQEVTRAAPWRRAEKLAREVHLLDQTGVVDDRDRRRLRISEKSATPRDRRR